MNTVGEKIVTGLEALQFAMESSITPMSGVGAEIYTLPKAYKGNFIDDLYRALLQTDVIEPFNQILHWKKLTPHKSYWTKTNTVDMAQHIKRHRLPKPGTIEQLYQLIQIIVAAPLDRSAPLWECHIVEGLENQQFAICGKGHHAHMDGTTAMARIISSKTTDPKDMTVRGIWSYLPELHGRPKLKKTARQTVQKGILNKISTLSSNSQQVIQQYRAAWREIANDVGAEKFIQDNILPNAPGSTAYNVAGDIGKSVATASFPLDKIKKIARARNCTVNDVYLTLVAGGMYGYLKTNDATPDTPLIIQMPMSLREPGDLDNGNKITTLFINLGEAGSTDLQRLKSISADTQSKKNIARQFDKRTLLAYGVLKAGSMAITSLNPNKTQTTNAIVSNVPGSKEKLYVMGAELKHMFAFNVLPAGTSLMIVGFSYAGKLDISLIAHRSAIPDLPRMAKHMQTSFNKLSKLPN